MAKLLYQAAAQGVYCNPFKVEQILGFIKEEAEAKIIPASVPNVLPQAPPSVMNAAATTAPPSVMNAAATAAPPSVMNTAATEAPSGGKFCLDYFKCILRQQSNI